MKPSLLVIALVLILSTVAYADYVKFVITKPTLAEAQTLYNGVLTGPECPDLPKTPVWIQSGTDFAFLVTVAISDGLTTECETRLTGAGIVETSVTGDIDAQCYTKCGLADCLCATGGSCEAPQGDDATNPCATPNTCYENICQVTHPVQKVDVKLSRKHEHNLGKVRIDGSFELFYPQIPIALGSCFKGAQQYVFSSADTMTFYGDYSGCDAKTLIEAMNAKSPTKADVEAAYPSASYGKATIIDKEIKVDSITSSEFTENYPAECVNGFALECYSNEKPQCNMPCRTGTACDPDESEKYCGGYQKCVKNAANLSGLKHNIGALLSKFPQDLIALQQNLPEYICSSYFNSSMSMMMMSSLLFITIMSIIASMMM